MKKKLLIMALISGATSFGQAVNDQVSVQPGGTNQVYYSLENGEVSNVSNQDWTLAFDLGGFGTGIRVNGQMGINVYIASTDTSDWVNLDTAGLSGWDTYYNSDTSWTNGALNKGFDPANQNDIGWGIYNTVTHHIIGNRIFALEFMDGSVKKLWIKSLISGTYEFKIANLDNTDEYSQNLVKSAYPNRNFVYYSSATNTIIDREPSNNEWDLVFTKYMGNLFGSTHYPVTGVLSNGSALIYEATGGIAENLEFSNTYNFTSKINTIGYDWKSFNGSGYTIKDSTAYFIETAQGDFWKVIMTGYGGSATGDIMFTKEQIGTANIAKNNSVELTVYPNPTTGLLRIQSSELLESISVYNYNGQSVFNANPISGTTEISLENLPDGIYFLRTTSESGKSATQKIVKI